MPCFRPYDSQTWLQWRRECQLSILTLQPSRSERDLVSERTTEGLFYVDEREEQREISGDSHLIHLCQELRAAIRACQWRVAKGTNYCLRRWYLFPAHWHSTLWVSKALIQEKWHSVQVALLLWLHMRNQVLLAVECPIAASAESNEVRLNIRKEVSHVDIQVLDGWRWLNLFYALNRKVDLFERWTWGEIDPWIRERELARRILHRVATLWLYMSRVNSDLYRISGKIRKVYMVI